MLATRGCPTLLLAAALGLSCVDGCARERAPTQAQAQVVDPPSRPAEADADPTAAQVRLAESAAASMSATMAELGLEPTLDGPRVGLGALTVEVEVELEHRGEHDGAHVLAARFMISIDARPVPAFTVSVVGVEGSPEAAERGALTEWYGQHGAPISFAVAELEQPERFAPPGGGTRSAEHFIRVLIDGVALYESPVGLRGGADVDVLTSDAFINQVARVAITHAGALQRYRGVAIEVNVEASGPAKASCLVDGEPAPSLCAALEAIEWPRSSAAYMYEQFFVLLGPKSAQ